MSDALKAMLIGLPLLIAVLVALAAAPATLEQSRVVSTFLQECVGGEAADNPLGPDGADLSRQELFPSVEQAEAFLCVDIPQFPPADGWAVRQVNALRSHSLNAFDGGDWTAGAQAFKYTETYYGNETLQSFVTLIVYPDDLPERSGIGIVCGPPLASDAGVAEEVEVSVQGFETTFWVVEEPSQGEPSASLCWERGDLSFFAGISFRTGLDVQSDVLPLLDSLE